jgi:hypothetical protein
VDDENLVTTASLDEYLQGEFIPYVTSFYDATVKSHTSMEDVFRLLLQAVVKQQLEKAEVRLFIHIQKHIRY